MVPQDPAGLFRKMGGRRRRRARLDYFLRNLTAAPTSEHALLGNEPTLRPPGYMTGPARPTAPPGSGPARALASTDTAPAGYPGNDDLGTLSAWYVFGALGLYPEVPGVGLLAIGSPLFERASIALPTASKR